MFLLLNAATRPNLRRRRDLEEVQFEVTMDISADDEDDFEEFQRLHDHSRVRRGNQQCRSKMCDGK